MGGDSNEQLVDSFRQTGEMRHLDELVHRHMPKVRAMIYPMVLNDADADEITQDVFIRMANGIDRFQGKALFSTWLYRIAMNTTHSFLRRKSRNPTDSHAEPPDQPDRAAGPDRVLMANETDSEIERALADLSPSLRSAITLTAIQGLSVTEAARIEHCLAATMYWRVHQARQQLKKRLGRFLAS